MEHLEVSGLGPVGRVGLGTWQFGSREWGYGQAYAGGGKGGAGGGNGGAGGGNGGAGGEAGRIVRRALELGVTLFDTAEVYGFGRSERILGEALGERRDDVVLASKVFPVAPFPAVVHQRAVASADRLGVRTIPLYQVHQANPLVPDSVIMPGMRRLLDEDRIRAVGVSNYSLDRWRAADRALGSPVVSNQVQFSLAHPGPLEDLVPFAEANDRIVMAWSPLAQGLLGGRYGEGDRPGGVRAANPLFAVDNLRRVQPLLDVLREVAAGHGVRPAQAALAWLVAQPRVVVIPGASSVEQLEFNVEAASVQLEPAAVAALTDAARAFNPASPARLLRDAGLSRLSRR